MKRVYLGEEDRHIKIADMKFDKIPAKSTFIDHNRSDIVMSKSFRMPNMDFFMSLCPHSK